MDDQERRQVIIARAEELYFYTGKTRNITEALRMYLENDAGPDEQIPLFVTSPERHQVKQILTQARPRCDECDAELNMQIGATDPAGKKYPTAWICKNCKIEYYSDKSPAEWLEELRIETRKQNLRRPDEPSNADMPAVQPAPEI